jgi:glycosyltransferase involved in cell wall biosynthesis
MMLYKLLSRMDRRRFDNVVVVFVDIGPIGSLLRQEGIPVYPLDMKSGSLSLPAFFRVLGIIRRERPAVLQSWGHAANLVAALAGILLGIRNVVWNIRGSKLAAKECSRATALARASCARLSRIPRLVLSNSEVGLGEHLAIGYRPRQSLIIPNGFDTELFKPDQTARQGIREELGFPDGVPVIGMIARFHPMKDHATFLAASEILVRTKPDTHFILCGIDITSDNRFLDEILAKHSSRENVHLLGERRDVPQLLNAMDIFALSSYSEGFPNVVGEAMACGVPCVVTDAAGDAPMIVGETGVIVPPKDPGALAQAWEAMVAMDSKARQRLGRRARERVQCYYNLPHIVEEYQRLYESLPA